MIPFLEKSQKLVAINVGGDKNINSEYFRLIVEALDGGFIRMLRSGGCAIDNISALEQCILPHLEVLNLENNYIESIPSLEEYTNLIELSLKVNNTGMEGCRSLILLLESTHLTDLFLVLMTLATTRLQYLPMP